MDGWANAMRNPAWMIIFPAVVAVILALTESHPKKPPGNVLAPNLRGWLGKPYWLLCFLMVPNCVGFHWIVG